MPDIIDKPPGLDSELDSEFDEFESGPFCQHWGDPSECEEPCACGHQCRHHSYGEECSECDCRKFTDPPEVEA